MRLPHLAYLLHASLLFLTPRLVTAALTDLPKLSDTSGANAPASATSAASKTAAAASKTAKASQSAAASSSNAKALPAITSSGSSGLKTGLPKLAGDDYPAPSVPPTADAPFMQKSNLPEGTVFICVGAALALIALIILAWRGIVAWSLHRSVRRSAMAQSSKYTYIGDNKSSRPSHLGSKLASPFAGSTLTLDQFPPSSTGAGGSKGGKSSSGPASRNSLFFSPTASHTAGNNMTPTSNRASAYLPAGYYASNAPSSAAHQQPGISMSNLNPNSSAQNRYSRHSRSIEPSPPPSSRGEGTRPNTGHLSVLGSGLNLSTTALTGAGAGGSEGRAPSAYLEDLFESAANSVAPVTAAAPVEAQKQQPRERERERDDAKKEKERDNGRRDRDKERDEGRRGGGYTTEERRREEGGRGEDSSRRRERRRSSHGGAESSGRRRHSRGITEGEQRPHRHHRRSSRAERDERRRSGY